MKKTLLLIIFLMIGTAMMAGCKNMPKITTHVGEYYTYIQYPGDPGAVKIRRLTEKGKELKELYIPAFVNDKPVTSVGESNFSTIYFLQSVNLEHLNYPYTIKEFKSFTGVPNLKTLVLGRVEPIIFNSPVSLSFSNNNIPKIYVPEGYANTYNEKQKLKMYYDANVSFMFNYEGAPNGGFYSVDYKEAGNILVQPQTPQREGYDFSGWYGEEECITPWDFNNTIETSKKLYALWIKKV
jgi:uncharacterized repeat protein (TIGR02543 family)